MIEIRYNGVDLFSGQNVPFVTKTVTPIFAGERWGHTETISLEGSLTGCSMTELEESRDALLSNLTQSFKNLTISGVGTFSGVRIGQINFNQSPYVGQLPYTISFEHFTGGIGVNYSVIDPSDEISYAENADRTMNISRTISAKGVNTQTSGVGNALDNAIGFVKSQTGNWIRPFVIDWNNDAGMHLTSVDENFNRITNVATLTLNYRSDLDNTDGSIINVYQYDITDQVGQIPIISYQGQIDIGKNAPSGIALNRLVYSNFKNRINPPFLTSENITEDTYINRLNYSFSYPSGKSGEAVREFDDDFTISLSETSSTSLFSVQVNGEIKTKNVCGTYEDVSGQIPSDKHFAIARQLYTGFYSTQRGSRQNRPNGIDLQSRPLNKQENYDQFSRSIGYSYSFDDRYLPPQFPNVNLFNSSVNVQKAVNKWSVDEYYQGGHYIAQDLNYNTRERVSVRCDQQGASGLSVNQSNLQSFTNGVFNAFKEGYKFPAEETKSFDKNNKRRTSSFSHEKSFEKDESFHLEF